MEASRAESAQTRRLPDESVARILTAHSGEMLRIARAYSATSSDAEDAYQNAVEALLTKAPTDDEGQLVAWLVVVTRNEALMIQRRQKHTARSSFETIAESWTADAPQLDEHVLESELLGQRREALARLRPNELRCLLLKAEGFSYEEISQKTGLSCASVNRYLSEGRRASRTSLQRIASGEECRRLEPVLSLIADGEASPAQESHATAHLSHCAACRVTLADFRVAPVRIAAFFPVAIAGEGQSHGAVRHAAEFAQNAYASLLDRFSGLAAAFQNGSDFGIAKKAATVTALTAALAAGGAGLEQVVSQTPEPRDGGDVVAQHPAAPTEPVGPTEPAGSARPGKDEPRDEKKPSVPTAAEAQMARDRVEPADEAGAGDAAAAEDPFASEPQLAPPDTNADGAGGETLDGLAP